MSGEYEEQEEEPDESTPAARARIAGWPTEDHRGRRPRFSTVEKRDLVIGSVLASLVALSITLGRFYLYKLFPDWSDYWLWSEYWSTQS